MVLRGLSVASKRRFRCGRRAPSVSTIIIYDMFILFVFKTIRRACGDAKALNGITSI